MEITAVLMFLALYGLVRYFMPVKIVAEEAGKAPHKNAIHFTPFEALGVTMFVYLVGQYAVALVLYLLPVVFGASLADTEAFFGDNNLGQFIFVAAIQLLTIWLLYQFLKRRHHGWATIGLGRSPRLSDSLHAIGAFVGYFIAVVAVMAIAQELIPSLNTDQQQILGFDSPAGWELPLIFISLVILPPLTEELLVRGFLYTGLKNGWTKWLAVVVASGLFAVAHLQPGTGEPLLWPAAIDTFVLSLFLIYLREKTGSLWASIFLHFIKNGIAFSVRFIFT